MAKQILLFTLMLFAYQAKAIRQVPSGEVSLTYFSFDATKFQQAFERNEKYTTDEFYRAYFKTLIAKDNKAWFGSDLKERLAALLPADTCKGDLNDCLQDGREMLGEAKLYRLAYLLDHYEINASQFQEDPLCKGCPSINSPFTLKELDLIHIALKIIPKRLHVLFQGKGLTMVDADTGIYANATMSFFSLWRNLEEEDRYGQNYGTLTKLYIVIHELCHVIGEKLNLDFSEQWRELHNKSKLGKPYEGFVSLYARGNLAEDFAESLAAYILAPSLLQRQSVKKFEYISKNVNYPTIPK